MEETGKRSTRRNDGVFEGHWELPHFPLLPLKESHPAQQSVACFSFPLGLSLFRGATEKERSEGQEQLILGHDAGGFAAHDLAGTDKLQTLQAGIKHSWTALEIKWLDTGLRATLKLS